VPGQRQQRLQIPRDLAVAFPRPRPRPPGVLSHKIRRDEGGLSVCTASADQPTVRRARDHGFGSTESPDLTYTGRGRPIDDCGSRSRPAARRSRRPRGEVGGPRVHHSLPSCSRHARTGRARQPGNARHAAPPVEICPDVEPPRPALRRVRCRVSISRVPCSLTGSPRYRQTSMRSSPDAVRAGSESSRSRTGFGMGESEAASI